MRTERGSRRPTRQSRSVRKAGGWRSSRLKERDARRRKEQMRLRIARLRDALSLRRPAARVALAVIFVISIAAGALLSHVVVGMSERALRPEPAPLRSIAVLGVERLSAREVAQTAGLEPNMLANEIAVSELEERLVAHPWIESARALLLPTGQLLVRVRERTPVAIICSPLPCSSDLARWRLVDARGIPFADVGSADDLELPPIVSQRTPAMQLEDPELSLAVDLLDRLPRAPQGSVVLQMPDSGLDEGWVLHLASPQRRVLLGARDLEQRLERLEWLLAADLVSARGAAVIDLRFAERAVLRSASASR